MKIQTLHVHVHYLAWKLEKVNLMSTLLRAFSFKCHYLAPTPLPTFGPECENYQQIVASSVNVFRIVTLHS